MAQPDRPNILFLMSDEHRPDFVGYAGHPSLRTPTLDHLAATGTVFENAYTPSPICIPARQCMAAGQLPMTCGCFRYGQDLPPFSMTFAKRLAQYGYQTTCAGKLHHTGLDQMQGWLKRMGSNMDVDVSNLDGFVGPRHERPPHWKWSDARELAKAGIGRCRDTHFGDEYAMQGLMKYIESYFVDSYYDRATPDRPLLLMASFNRPHYPYFTSKEKFDHHLNRVKSFENEEVFDHPFLSQRHVPMGDVAIERDVQRARAAYCGMIEEIDEDYGRILGALEDFGQNLDDWVIIYTSDHGEMLGEHGIWEKQKFFEASARVPLIIRWPQKFNSGPSKISENVNLCDLFATFCDLTGTPAPEGLDSRSLVPLLEGQCENWNNETISHFGKNNLMIKRDALKYQYYGEDMPEVLFDLEADPTESENLIGEAKYRDAVAAFRRRRSELGYGPDADPNYINAGYSPC